MDNRNKPFSNDEIRDLLTSTLHGSLPIETHYRLLATVAELPDLRDAAELREAALREVVKLASDRELYVAEGPRMGKRILTVAKSGLPE